ncbi:hypothetical protein TNCV_2822571 [Trichonephila clavipes]|nr:hypothetical protein TNCV_2822571 [Trichonephila clavipes]
MSIFYAPYTTNDATNGQPSNGCSVQATVKSFDHEPSERNDTFVDSELFSNTGQTTPFLQLSDHSSTCELIQRITPSRIS